MPPVPTVTLLDPDGTAHAVPVEDAATAIDAGWRSPQHADVLAASTRAAKEADYGGAAGALKAGAAGFARGATLGLSDVAARAIGDEDTAGTLSGYREAHPGVSFGSEFLGALAPALVSGGGSAPASLAARAGRAVAAGAESSLGRFGAAAAGGAAEGALFGAGTGVSELALSDDPLTMEHAASVLSSNALFGAGLGAGGGVLAKGAEIGLGRAKQAIDSWRLRQSEAPAAKAVGALDEEFTAARQAETNAAGRAVDELSAEMASSPPSTGADAELSLLDRKGLKSVREQEVANLDASREPLREKFAQDLETAHRAREDAKDWLAGIADRDPDKYTREAAKVVFNQDRRIRNLLDDKIGLIRDPEMAARNLRTERQALESLADAEPRRIAEYNAEVAGAPAKIRQELIDGKLEGYVVGKGALSADSPIAEEIVAREFAKRYPQYAEAVDAAIAQRNAVRAVVAQVPEPAAGAAAPAAPAATPQAPRGPATPLSQSEYQALVGESTSKLDKAAQDALQGYAKNGAYGVINSNLREFEATPRLKAHKAWEGQGDRFVEANAAGRGQHVRDLDRAISESPAPRSMVVYRGVSGEASERFGKADLHTLKPGDSFVDHGFVSTSADASEVAKSYAKGMGVRPGVEMQIEVPQGHPIAPIASDTFAESEMLLGRGTKFTVVSTEKAADGSTVLKLRVGDPEATGALLPDGPSTPPSAAGSVKLSAAAHESNALVSELRQRNPELGMAIDDYTKIARRKDYHIAETADGMCDTAEQEFRTKYGLDNILSSHRFDTSDAAGMKELQRNYHMTKKQVMEVRAEFKRRVKEYDIPKEDFFHQVSVTHDGIVIDWTANQFNELPVPYVYRPSRAIPRDIPEYAKLKSQLDKRGVDHIEQTIPAREIAQRGYYEPPGGGLDEARVENARKAIREGQREAVTLNVTPSGKIMVDNGRHRLAAAIEQDKPIKVKWSTGYEPAEDAAFRPPVAAPEGARPPPLDLDSIIASAPPAPTKELSGFSNVHDMLARNKQLLDSIEALKAKPASERLDAIDAAIENLGSRTAPPLSPREPTPTAPPRGAAEEQGGHLGVALSLAAGFGGPVGYVAARGAQAMGLLKKAQAFAADRGSKAASAFLDVARRGAASAAPYAPIVATKVLAGLRYAERARGEEQPTTLPELYKARTDEIKEQVHALPDGTIQMKPEARARMAARFDGIRVLDPVAADRLEELASRRLEWLASQMPKKPDVFFAQIGPDKWHPPDLAMRSWARKAAAADDPYGVIERAAHGAVTPEDVQAMKATAPEILNDWVRGQITPNLATLRATLPYERRMALSMLSGQPVDPAMDPRIRGVLQGHFTNEPGTNAGTQAPKPISAFGSIKKSLDQPTTAQARGAR